MKRLIILANLIIAGLILFTPAYVLADRGGADNKLSPVDTRPYRISPTVVTQATGRTWYDTKSGAQIYEYKARIDSAPAYVENQPIDCTWYKRSSTKWEAGANLFTATVSNKITSVEFRNSDILWSPQVFIGGKEYNAQTAATLLETDPINENYHYNTLSWDYGVCERRLRLIEGMISETYVFTNDPGADIQIKSNAVADDTFVWVCPVFAYDAAGGSIPISADKTVKASDLKGAAYPITIDPTEVFTTSASDGDIYIAGPTIFSYIRSLATGTVYDGGTNWHIGMYKSGAYYAIYRGFVFFDTTSIPDSATITTANVSLYGYIDASTVNFNMSIQSGMPTYPHDPLVTGDYDMTHYSGIGGELNTSSFVTTGYNNISLNSSGIAWIDKTGATKLCIRSSNDINNITPTGNQYVHVYSYEKGVGYQPTLYITYFSSGIPTVTTNPSTYITKTTAQLNGYLNTDGGEVNNVNFNYKPWYNSSWSDCIEFTINHSYVNSDLYSFPVLVTGSQLNTTDPDFWSTTNWNGSDILFTSSNGVTKLPREIVSFCQSTWSMECYVNVSTVSSTTDTKFYMYYNNSAGNENNSTAVWDNNYVFVSHMNDNPNTSSIIDSTVNGRIGTKKGANEPLEIAGNFSGDKAQKFDGNNDYIVANAKLVAGLGNVTVLAIINSANGSGAIAGDYTGGADTTFTWELLTTVWRVQIKGQTAARTSMGNSILPLTLGNWQSVSWRWNSSFCNYYVNGSADRTTAYADAQLLVAPTLNTYFGAYKSSSGFMNGSITELRFSNVSRSDAWRKATYYSSMYPTLFAPVTDVFTSTATQSKNTGDSFNNDISGLTANTLYGYKTEASNTLGTAWGAWVIFTTLTSGGTPVNMSAYPGVTTVDLQWQKDTSASTTMIRYQVGAYPTSPSDGDLIYNGSSNSYIHTGLTPGTNYYYRAWSDGGIAPLNYSSVMTTTLAGDASAAVTPTAPEGPTGWFSAPDYTHMANMPFYDINNAIADSIHMPYNTFWMGWAIVNVVLAGLISYFLSKGNLLIAVGVSAVIMALFATQEIISWWYIGLYLIAAIAFSFKAVTR